MRLSPSTGRAALSEPMGVRGGASVLASIYERGELEIEERGRVGRAVTPLFHRREPGLYPKMGIL